LSDPDIMKGNELIKKVKKLAKKRSIKARVDEKRGKGSHVTLYFGDKFTIVRNPKDELKTGTLNAILKQLGIKEDEI
jgi:mRNA interferase HicA